MAASIIVETECGTYVGSRHPHNGYYAGDFSSGRHGEPATPTPHGDLRPVWRPSWD